MEDGDYRNWAELPPELTSSILLRLGAIEILENAQKVCKSWRRVCKDPSMWRKIDIDNRGGWASFKYDLESMCRHAVDRSQGGLVEIDIWYFGTDELLDYIADRFSLSPCNSKPRGIFEFFFETTEVDLISVVVWFYASSRVRTDFGRKVPILCEIWGNYC